jgi:short-subunit dehydrogenase
MSAWLPAPDPETTCLVTGASSGIGEAIARELASRGHGVILVARREERLRALAAELAADHFVRAEPLACDLADAEARALLAERVEALGMHVDVLVNNAGLGSYGAFVAADRKREALQVRVMCEAVVDLCGSFAPAMATRGGGAILIVSSSLALVPMARYATYGATRAFCLSFGESLHAELRQADVAVTTLCPGPVETGFFAANGPQPVQNMVPKPMWQSAGTVARVAIDGLSRNRRVVIPGASMRTAMAGARLVPRAARLRVLDRLVRVPGEA